MTFGMNVFLMPGLALKKAGFYFDIMELVYTLLQWDEAEMELVPEMTPFHPSCCYYAGLDRLELCHTHTHTHSNVLTG